MTSNNKLHHSVGDQQIWSEPDGLPQDPGQEERHQRQQGVGWGGEDLFDVKRERKDFLRLTTKKGFFCGHGCRRSTRSSFLPFTLYGSEDLKIDFCSQRV